MSQLIYVETSIPSFYFETRPGSQMEARREWTREWLEIAIWRDHLVTSAWVFLELDETPEPRRSDCAGLLDSLRLLESLPEIDRLVESYIQHKVMPADADGDARHLAVATYWGCDALVTWNCRHIANANKTGHIRTVNKMLGYDTPLLLTPLELLEIEP
ncbi:MAG: hypothetical protein ABIZ56_08600 [Chthoniobacteraceae bacterium]